MNARWNEQQYEGDEYQKTGKAILTESQALDLSWYMLATIQAGGSFSYGDWYDLTYAIREAKLNAGV